MAYVIFATQAAHDNPGGKRVVIAPGTDRAYYQRQGDKAAKAGVIRDYQTAVCDDLNEVRSCLMSNFGIGFYNVARSQIAALAQAGGSL